MPKLFTTDQISASTPKSSTAQDESSWPLVECHVAAAVRMQWYRPHHLVSNTSLKFLLLGNRISASLPLLSSPSPPNASAFTVFRTYRVSCTQLSVYSLPWNSLLRLLLLPVSSSPPLLPPVILPEGDNNTNTTFIKTLLLQVTYTITHIKQIRIST